MRIPSARHPWSRDPVVRRTIATTALVVVLVASLSIGIVASVRLAVRAADNGIVRQLAAGIDIDVAEKASPLALFARAHFLMVHDRFDEARALVDRIVEKDRSGLAAPALYDLANARLRRALDLLGEGKIDPAVPLVRLAKSGYRQALGLDPGFWDAKYNLDVAMRLVRDFPQIEGPAEDPPPGAKKRPWTDLPGLPKGLP